MQSLKFGIEGSMECKGTDHGWSTEHYSHAEVLSQTEYRALLTCRGTVHRRSMKHCTQAEVLFMEDYSWSIVHESQSTKCWVAGHAKFVGRLRQCRDQQLDLLAWLARAVVVLFSEPVCFDALIYELKVSDAAMLQV
jgi:hypothetical protein